MWLKREDISRFRSSPVMNANPRIASMYKIGFHKKRIKSYLKGENIFPVTLELDITSQCNRNCPDCPSTRGSHKHNLKKEFIYQLFSSLSGQTKGLLLTGGEPTLSPLFSETLRLARQNGFVDIAVVTNGSLLDVPSIQDSLLQYASTIRLSLYDWEKSVCNAFESTLRRIESLRKMIDQNGSKLQIGISALTSEKRSEKLQTLTDTVQAAGVHWIYFHPFCTKWKIGRPTPKKQAGVLDKIGEIQAKSHMENQVFFSQERYEKFPLVFKLYHAAYFLLVIGADAKNYLGPEVKYHPRFVAADLTDMKSENFLWEDHRRDFINSIRSENYPAIRSRHRSVLYNHFIEQLQNENISDSSQPETPASMDFYFPYIL
jgi:organic radical activating enzyme